MGKIVRRMKERVYKLISVEDIVIINSRSRDKEQFSENIRSIKDVGLYKPIIVNSRNYNKTKKYELICGEGRLTAFKHLKKKKIKAEIVNLDADEHQIMTLAENITRIPQQSIEYGYAIKDMHDRGVSWDQMIKITGRSRSYLQKYIVLVSNGEERLIKAVEDGDVPISFALNISKTDDSSIQNLLIDAYDHKLVDIKNMSRIRKIIDGRLNKGKKLERSQNSKNKTIGITVKQLRDEVRKTTEEKEGFVKQASQKESRLFRLAESIRILRTDTVFIELLKKEEISNLPQLHGKYGLE